MIKWNIANHDTSVSGHPTSPRRGHYDKPRFGLGHFSYWRHANSLLTFASPGKSEPTIAVISILGMSHSVSGNILSRTTHSSGHERKFFKMTRENTITLVLFTTAVTISPAIRTRKPLVNDRNGGVKHSM